MKICFLENTSFEYSYKDKNEPLLRGGESIMLNLSNELKKLGLDVFVFNNCTEEVHKSNAHWYNINHLTQFDEIVFDFAIANGDASLLNKVKARKYMVYSHSIQSIEKFIKKTINAISKISSNVYYRRPISQRDKTKNHFSFWLNNSTSVCR